MLHVDIAFILLPICRNFISLLRRTPLNSFIPFDKNITFHKAVAWSIVIFSIVHIVAHMVNFTELAMVDPDAKTTGQKVVAFIAAFGIAHFTLVVGGFTGARGYAKLEVVQEWLHGLLSETTAQA